jgi:hypothetical protein
MRELASSCTAQRFFRDFKAAIIAAMPMSTWANPFKSISMACLLLHTPRE